MYFFMWFQKRRTNDYPSGFGVKLATRRGRSGWVNARESRKSSHWHRNHAVQRFIGPTSLWLKISSIFCGHSCRFRILLCGICGSKHIKTYQSKKRQDELVTILVYQHSVGKALIKNSKHVFSYKHPKGYLNPVLPPSDDSLLSSIVLCRNEELISMTLT